MKLSISPLFREEFDLFWQIYEASFPHDERRSLENQKKTMLKEEYHLESIKENDVFVGFISYWNFRSFVFVEHVAIAQSFRNQGFGREVLIKFFDKHKVPIIGEVEKENEIRIDFFKSLGVQLNKYEYIQPPYEQGKQAVPLFVMSYPLEINEDQFEKIKRVVYEKVYEIKSE